MDVIARFPARPDSSAAEPPTPPERADRGPKRPVKPMRPSPSGRREQRETSMFPTRSVAVLAIVAAGIWGLALRNELVRRGAAPVEVAAQEERSSQRLASEPVSERATDTRIAK